jgi:pilus assembly protein CpaD
MKSLVRAFAAWGGFAGRAATIATLATTLAGCFTPRETIDPVPLDFRQRHPITLQESNRSMQVFIGNSRGSLTPSQRADVISFAHVWKGEATGGIVIDVPAGTPNQRAAADVVHEIQSVLAATGVPPEDIATRPYKPVNPAQLATVRLNYPRISAQAGPCGLWPHDLGPSDVAAYDQNKEYWNFGCASQHNLAAMIENPTDLVQARGEEPPYRGRRTVVLDKYRKGDVTSSANPNADKGKISDIGH